MTPRVQRSSTFLSGRGGGIPPITSPSAVAARSSLLFVLALLIALLSSACSTTKGYKPSDDVSRRIVDVRKSEIKRQSAAMGIPHELAASVLLTRLDLCPETGRNSDGSFTCNDCTGVNGTSCVHAYFMGAQNVYRVRYMFAVPELADGTIRHEVHHELCVIFYGISGHPARSNVTRLDNGRPLTIDHAAIIGWRWPSLVNWALPESMKIGNAWGNSFNCGVGEVFEDGAGI